MRGIEGHRSKFRAMAFKFRVREILITAVAATLIGLPCLFMYHKPSAEHIQSALSSFNFLRRPEEPDEISEITEEELKELDNVLARASMENRTVIITTLNEAWAANNTMIDLYLESFHRGKNITKFLDHLVIVTLDQTAQDRCLQLHPHCFRLKTVGVDFTGEKRFMTKEYLKMMWRRIKFLGGVLEMGYSFVFSDADILWFRNPFASFSNNADFQIACDRFRGKPFTVEKNTPNGGFVYVRSNQRTIAMYKYWYEARIRIPRKHDQDVLNVVLREEAFLRMGVKIRFLDTDYFSGFCQKSKDMARVVTMHANCCKGLDNKLKDLRLALEDWTTRKATRRLRQGRSSNDLKLWRAPRACRKKRWAK